MQRLYFIFPVLSGLLVFTLGLTACSSDLGRIPASQTPPSPVSDFAGVLNYIPYSFLEKQDIWFSNPQKARQLYGIENVTNYTEFVNLPRQEQRDITSELSSIADPSGGNKYMFDMAGLVGFDDWLAARLVFPVQKSPWPFTVRQGNFSKELIDSKLIEQGYAKTSYAGFTCYSIRDDFEADRNKDLQPMDLAGLNRIAVLDNIIVTAPSTGILTDILDSISGNNQSMLKNGGVLALTSSLKEVLSGAIISPERIIAPFPGQSTDIQPFDFKIPENWGLLHEYDLIGMGYKESGQERTWTISLYYNDAQAASEDAATLVTRLKSYEFGTSMEYPEGLAAPRGNPLTSEFEVGEPQVQPCSTGSTLTVDCRYKPETGSQAWLKHVFYFRDLLFLAPDPAPYVKTVVNTPSTPLSLEESGKQLKEQGFTLTDTAEKASRLVGYQVTTPSFVPAGFTPGDNNGRAGIFMISQIGSSANPAAVFPFEVSQHFSPSQDARERVSFFVTFQTTQEMSTAGVELEDIEIGGQPAKKSLIPARGNNPAILNLYWSDGILNYRLEGELSGILDETTLIKVAASMRTNQ